MNERLLSEEEILNIGENPGQSSAERYLIEKYLLRGLAKQCTKTLRAIVGELEDIRCAADGDYESRIAALMVRLEQLAMEM